MRVVIVDDEPLARRGVAVRLAGHADIEIAGEFEDGPSALEGIVKLAPDLAFVDVQMPGMSGLEWLAALSAAERPMPIMLTAHDSFAIRAFELHAIDYLLKPIDDERFAEALDRARQALPYRRKASASMDAFFEKVSAGHLERFNVRIGTRVLLVDAHDVDWIEADGDYAVLHVGEEAHLLREPLRKLADRLDPTQFVRVHRSAIVRIDRIAEMKALVNRDVLLRLLNGAPLRASRTYVDQLHEALRLHRGAGMA